MANKIEISRELLQRWIDNTDFFEDLMGKSMHEIDLARKEDDKITEELRALLAANEWDGPYGAGHGKAAPAVERQEPVAMMTDGREGELCVWFSRPPNGTKLYTSPPAPVAVVLSDDDLIEIAQKATVASVHRYAYMPAHADSAKYFKPHQWVIDAMRACLDKVKELNQ